MNDLTPILLLVLAGAVAAVVFLWRKTSKLEELLGAEQKALEGKRDEIERARKEVRDRREELEQTRKQLQEAKAKVQRKKELPAPQEKAPAKKAAEVEAAPTLAAFVRVTDQEVEEAHRRAIERLEQELEGAKTELSRLKELDARREAEARRAAEALERERARAAGGDAPPKAPEPPPPPAASAAEEIEALKTQIEALKRASVERERELSRRLAKAEGDNAHVLRRAANNLQLYQVIKGQLELTEDKLAGLRRKYEGAKSIDELRREEGRSERRERRRDRRRDEGGEASAERPAEPGAEAAPGTAAAAVETGSPVPEVPPAPTEGGDAPASPAPADGQETAPASA